MKASYLHNDYFLHLAVHLAVNTFVLFLNAELLQMEY